MEFSRQEFWAGCHFLLQGIFLTQESNPCLLNWQVDFLLTSGQYSSVAQSCPTPCNPMDCNMPGLSVPHYLPDLAQTYVHWVGDTIPTIWSSAVPFSSWIQSFPASGSFPMSQLFASGGQSIGASASASALPIYIQGWFPLGLTGLITLQSKGLSRVLHTIVQKHQFLYLLSLMLLPWTESLDDY